MNASQPEAGTEYSTRHRASDAFSGRPGGLPGALPALAVAGAALLLAAELSPLLHVRTATRPALLVRTVQTGPHHGWALVPIALGAVLLTVGAWRAGGRLAPLLIATLGIVALAVALLADLPAAHATGLVGHPATGLHDAAAHAAAGLYLETLGAVALLVAGVVGTLLSPRARRRSRPRSGPRSRSRG